ncbi:MAG: hypothetical protein HZB83_05640, partial [Deltaproteobacteria bacterium]|nr:hypothetical protein [Deltaproteobacteria bacterium]
MGTDNRKDKRFGIKTMLFVALVSIMAGVAVSARFDITNPTAAQNFWRDSGEGAPPAISRTENFVELSKRLSPAVVNISTTQIIKERPILPFPDFKGPSLDDFFGDEFNRFLNEPQKEFKRQSLGSGFIINKEG